MKKVKITDFLNEDQIKKCLELKKAHLIHDQVIKENIKEIDDKLGQENDPLYLSYLIEYLIDKTS